jgi:putative membrane protein
MAVSDPLFLTAAAGAELAEVSLSELGAQKATDPELKKFSQQMIQEHTRMNGQVQALAAQKGVPIPRAVDARAAFCAQSLAGLSGEEFDKCYARAQCVAHMESLAMFEAEAERGADPQIKQLASQGVQHIRDHLHQIKPIAEKYMKDEKDQKDQKDGGSSSNSDR